MKVSYNWLKEYLDFNISAQELADYLTNSGIEVEGIHSMHPGFENVVVGKVLEVNKHPQADKLSVTKVNVDKTQEPMSIVCGAPNVKKGQKVPVAKVGGKLPDGMKIKKAKLRGEKSFGMICSCEELGLLAPEKEEGIMVLAENAPVGEPLESYLGLDDEVLEFDLTPNRADCLGMLGVAREVAAVLDIPINVPKVTDFSQNKTLDNVNINIQDSDLCERYVGMLIENVNIGISPMWLQQRLRTYGIRPINNLVDITNYVMLEYGQPLHAFDYDLVSGDEIIVRRAKDEEEIVTLNEKTRKLTSNDLVIADKEKAIAVAGVMGGYATEVSEKSNRILLESAAFNNISVRRTANRLNLRSDASLRFEKGVDPNNTLNAAFRAVELIEQLGVGTVVVGAFDEYPKKREQVSIELRVERVRQLTGIDISKEEIRDLFRRLQFDITDEKEDSLNVTVPTRRNDITLEVDLIEEIARLYGYDKIPTTMPKGRITQGRKTHRQQVEDTVRETMLSSGLSEIISYTFISPEDYNKLNFSDESSARKSVPIANPLTKEQSIMRTTLLPSIMKILSHNFKHGEKDHHIFEIGKIYLPEKLPLDSLPNERNTLIFGGMGAIKSKSWLEQPQKIDFFYVKGMFELLLERLNIGFSDVSFKPEKHPSFHPTRTAGVYLDERKIGIMGEMHPAVVKENYDIDTQVVLAEIDLESIYSKASLVEKFTSLPKYPAVLRDIALLVPSEIPEEQVSQVIINVGEDLIEDINLFDLYQGERIPENMKSLAYSIKFRDPNTTLTDDRVDKVYEQIEEALKSEIGAEIRKA
ncbi:phenylalanine--tRNA ligase subunit beta [Natranaerobius trueperi]|uniref:Phenylalanine--tRNA ligase beta subunit n=1 Tax=Natranaerobius trueperi TaxID=759412 RepID=A0A226BXE4_9FIRM|nr:phenylalanine--tRNA ligase subunit beta [Natranaerobius trueperi]OWZ82869.1 phenylalanine--tRNA ligase subunit beta [Natranaerobius trueperi]